MSDLSELERILGYSFKNRSLLERVLTHGTSTLATDETRLFVDRMSWLGDAMFYAFVSEELVNTRPGVSKEALHEERESLKTNRALGLVAEDLGLYDCIEKGDAVSKNPNADNRYRMLATHMEAVIGAICVDSRNEPAAVRDVVQKLWRRTTVMKGRQGGSQETAK